MGLRRIGYVTVALVMLALSVAPASATTLMRMDLDELATSNQMAVLGEVIDSHSYWNSDGTFILTDVRVAVLEVLKGNLEPKKELEITLMGGEVGDLTALIIAGAVLVPETSYVLFLNAEDLPGAEGVLTVRDHSQGVFEVSVAADQELRAVSQANGHALVADASGATLAPGGFEGLPLDDLIRDIRAIANRQTNSPRR